jgi:hypothetical protein
MTIAPGNANYVWLEPSGGYTFPTGFRRDFFALPGRTLQAYFTVALRTDYATENLAASVRVNGTEIGKVAPRPRQPGEFMLRAEHVFFPCLNDQLFIPQGYPNRFEIIQVPGSGINGIVRVRHVIFHYWWWVP